VIRSLSITAYWRTIVIVAVFALWACEGSLDPGTESSEDLTIGIDGSNLMGEGARLFRYPSGGSDWGHLLSGSSTRSALSPTGRHLAIVVKES